MEITEIILFIAKDIIGNPGLFYGLLTLLGLILLKRSYDQIIAGTVKTIAGFYILVLGAVELMNCVAPIGDWTKSMLGVEGVIPQNWLIFGKAMTEYPTEVAMATLLGFIINLILAYVTPLKAVYVTGHIMMIWASYFVGVPAAYNFSSTEIVLLAGVACGIYYWLHTWICYQFMKGNDRLTDEWSLGIGEALGIATTSWLSKKIGRREVSTEELPFPESLAWLRDPMLSVAVFTTFIYLIIGLAAGPEAVAKFSGGAHWLVWLLLQGIHFGASLAALLYGVRMLLGELVPAFKGISERLIPGAVPGLDYPTMFPFAPTAVFIGFVMNLLGGILATITMVALRFPVIILPAIWMNFWTGAMLGVFANAWGGLRATIIVPFIWGFIAPFGWALAYPVSGIFIGVGTQDYTDYTLIGPIYGYFIKYLAETLGRT
ncbi:hypothetical protein DRP04_09410 [Archaeoglobales archaeon]|nr:MAG: hypothetical protein DRP04_09410 [Archaeoglobales archaeon]